MTNVTAKIKHNIRSIIKAMGTTGAISTTLILATQPLFAETPTRIAQIAWNSPQVQSIDEDDTEAVDIGEVAVDVRKLPNRAGSLPSFGLNNTTNNSDSLDSLVTELSGSLSVSARSAMVLDANTGEVLYGKDADQVVPIASITKLMTAMVTADARLDMHEILTLQPEDFQGPKKASSKLHVGDQLNRAELLLLALMKSENPAAAALARTYPKGWDKFMLAMNNKARALGMTTAYFGDPTGLDVNNVASARDLAKMVRAASQYSIIKSFSSTQQYDFNLGDRILHAKNTNAIVREGMWDIGLSKTGYINEAGRCVVMQAQVNKRPAVIVVMGAKSSQGRTGDAKRILTWLMDTLH